MIKQRQTNTTKRHLNTKIKDGKDLLNSAKEVNETTIGILTVCGEGLEENLEKYIPKNVFENYKNTALEGKLPLNQLNDISTYKSITKYNQSIST